MTVLYVDGLLAPVTLALDGPSLVLLREGRAPDRAPFRRLSRVVLRGPVRLEGEVIPALLRAGIGVSWIDGRGDRLGSILPARLPRTDTAALVEAAMRAGVAAEIRDSWRSAEERRVVLDLMVELGLRSRDLRRATVERLVLAMIDRVRAPVDGEDVLRRLRALLAAHLTLVLQQEGLGFRFQGGDPEGWNLLADLTELNILALVPAGLALARFVAAEPERHDTPSRLARRFMRRYEREAPRVEALVSGQLARLRRVIREALE